jgi:hypothetical protein
MVTFSEATEGWMLMGMVLAQRAIERGRPLAKTPRDEELLGRIFEHYKEEVMDEIRKRKHLGHDLSQEELVLQTSSFDLYSGPLLHNRFQVMGSVVPQGTFYLVDHQASDLLHREAGPGSNIQRFPSIQDAKERAGQLAKVLITDQSPQNAAKPLTKKVRTVMAKSPAGAKAAPASAKAEKTATPSAASRFRELIMAGKQTDDAIFDTVAKEFNLDEKKRVYVSWYRKDLEKKGLNPPPAVAFATKAQDGKPAPKAAAPKTVPGKVTVAPGAKTIAPKGRVTKADQQKALATKAKGRRAA